jgi:HK97 family phage major capsid protein
MPKLLERLDAAEKRLAALTKGATTNRPDPRTPKPSDVFGAPHARKGEDPMTSRGFQYMRVVKAMQSNPLVDKSAWENAKVERSVLEQLREPFGGGVGAASFEKSSVLAPFGVDLFPEQMGADTQFGQRIKSLVMLGTENADPEEMSWIARKAYNGINKDMSWLNQNAGGALVGPPQMGELIDLFRNEDALTRAGATVIPMPPSGRIQFPRQTTPTTGYWVGENRSTTASEVGTGMLTLSAKKAGVIITMPNELIRFAGPAAEMLFRADMTKTLALTVDLAALEGAGGDLKPTGIINTPGIGVVAPTTAATGNTGALLAEGDVYKWPMKAAQANARFEGFLMSPSMYYALLQRRTGGSASGDGVFAFAPFRQLGDKVDQLNINGHRVTISNQVGLNRVQGSTSNLTYILGGMFSDVMLAMFGAIEFAVATQGDTIFPADQTSIRAFLICDSGVRHPGALAWCDKLQQA